jgi:hypothetical protein
MFSRRPGHRFNRGRIATVAGASSPPPVIPSPLDIYGADLYQGLRGDLGITIVTGVNAWADQSGKGNNAIQGTGTAQPLYTANDATLNNQPTVTADGANDVLASAGLTLDLATEDFYFCAILKQVSWTASDAISSGGGVLVPRVGQSGVSPGLAQLASVVTNINNAGTVGSWFRVEAFFSTTVGTSYLKVGGTQVQTGNPGTGTRTSSSLFAATAALFSNTSMAEFFVVKRAIGSGPTGGERTNADAYLQSRYPAAGF